MADEIPSHYSVLIHRTTNQTPNNNLHSNVYIRRYGSRALLYCDALEVYFQFGSVETWYILCVCVRVCMPIYMYIETYIIDTINIFTHLAADYPPFARHCFFYLKDARSFYPESVMLDMITMYIYVIHLFCECLWYYVWIPIWRRGLNNNKIVILKWKLSHTSIVTIAIYLFHYDKAFVLLDLTTPF